MSNTENISMLLEALYNTLPGTLVRLLLLFTIFFEGGLADATNFRIYGRPQQRELRPLLFASLLGSLMSPTTQYREDTRDGANGFSSSSEKTRMSNRLQMS